MWLSFRSAQLGSPWGGVYIFWGPDQVPDPRSSHITCSQTRVSRAPSPWETTGEQEESSHLILMLSILPPLHRRTSATCQPTTAGGWVVRAKGVSEPVFILQKGQGPQPCFSVQVLVPYPGADSPGPRVACVVMDICSSPK